MRTTIRLDERLLAEAKKYAAESGRTLTAVLANALRETLARRRAPGTRHWDIFRGLCMAIGVRGNLVPDAYLAAMAIESGCE